MTSRLRRASPYLLAGLLTAAGTLHFVLPRPYAEIVPDRLPAPYALVYASGVAELACAAGLVVPRTRRLAGWATALLFGVPASDPVTFVGVAVVVVTMVSLGWWCGAPWPR